MSFPTAQMKNSVRTISRLVLALLLGCTAVLASPSDQSDVRAAVQHIFDQLKNGQYEALYDSLPASARTRLSRERLVSGLQRTRNLYQLQRIEIGAVSVSGNLAVVDTTMFAHIATPFDADGKLVVQQYLVREDGKWKVATGDDATINRFLKSNPGFARRFPIRKPRAFVNQNGKWIEIPLGQRRA
ncbi:MAG: hypothetical protein ABR607_11415 [Pyrinomonadaceae bacterium]